MCLSLILAPKQNPIAFLSENSTFSRSLSLIWDRLNQRIMPIKTKLTPVRIPYKVEANYWLIVIQKCAQLNLANKLFVLP